MQDPNKNAYVYSDVQIKYASKDIAASENFRDKWKMRSVVIAITDFWGSSGAAQHAFADTLQLVLSAPFTPDCIAVMEASDEAIACAECFLSHSENSFVAYDSTSTLDAMFPAQSFVLEETPLLPRGVAVRYAGDISHIPPNVIKGVSAAAILAAESALRDICHDKSDPWDWPSFSTFRGQENIIFGSNEARRYVNILSCGRLSVPTRRDFEICLDANIDDLPSKLSLLSFHSYTCSLPVEGNIQEYSHAVSEAVAATECIQKIWETALAHTPFVLSFDTIKIAKKLDAMDIASVTAIGDVLGVTSMIDAYLDGVPIGDILA